jgi:hypothetical protein
MSPAAGRANAQASAMRLIITSPQRNEAIKGVLPSEYREEADWIPRVLRADSLPLGVSPA